MQVVAIQLDSVWENKDASHQRVLELIEPHLGQIEPNSLIVLAEMFDTGFSMKTEKTCQSEARESEEFLKRLAKQTTCAVLAGVASPRLPNQIPEGDTGSPALNHAVAFSPAGEELVRYQKMQPFSVTREEDYYGRGNQHHLFQWQGVTISPFICFDLRFPEIFRPATADGAELIIVIACWPTSRSEHWVRLLQARAIENQAVVVGVNRCGQEPHLVYDGRSSGFDEMGKCLFELDDQEQIRIVDIDIGAVRRWRQKFPGLDQMRTVSLGN